MKDLKYITLSKENVDSNFIDDIVKKNNLGSRISNINRKTNIKNTKRKINSKIF